MCMGIAIVSVAHNYLPRSLSTQAVMATSVLQLMISFSWPRSNQRGCRRPIQIGRWTFDTHLIISLMRLWRYSHGACTINSATTTPQNKPWSGIRSRYHSKHTKWIDRRCEDVDFHDRTSLHSARATVQMHLSFNDTFFLIGMEFLYLACLMHCRFNLLAQPLKYLKTATYYKALVFWTWNREPRGLAESLEVITPNRLTFS